MDKPLEARGRQGIWEIDNALLLQHLGLEWIQTGRGKWSLLLKNSNDSICFSSVMLSGKDFRSIVFTTSGSHYTNDSDDCKSAIGWATEEAILQWCSELSTQAEEAAV